MVEVVEGCSSIKGKNVFVETSKAFPTFLVKKKHSLPTGDIRQQRNMSPTAACSICGQEDSWRHSLIECNMARCVWVLTADDIVEHISGSTEPSARNWLFAMMETMKTEDLTRMLVTLWAI
jgi:hypothetical protein